jgi:hypothetical protein
MFGISPTLMIALGVLTVAALFLMTPLGMRKRKRPEKWEKAEIMRQLLALSEQDQGLKATAPSVRLRAPAPKPAGRPGTAHMKASSKTTLPSRSKAR